MQKLWLSFYQVARQNCTMFAAVLACLVLGFASANLCANELQIEQVKNVPAVLSPQLLRAPPSDWAFVPLKSSVLSQKATVRSLWRITLPALAAIENGTAVLVIGQSIDRDVILYAPPSYAPQVNNLADARYQTRYSRNAMVLELDTGLRAGDAIWLEFKDPRSAATTLAIRDRTEQAQVELNNVRFYTAMMVLMLACCGIAACFYFVLRESIWLLYITKVLSYWIYMGARTGEFASFADGWGLSAWVPFVSMPLGNAAAAFGAGISACFAVYFVDPNRLQKRLSKVVLTLGALLIVLSPIALIADSKVVSAWAQFANLLLIINSCLTVTLMIRAARTGSRAALFCLIADLAIVLTLFLQVGTGMGWLNFAELSTQIFIASHAFAGVVVSLGLADQVLGYRNQRDEARITSERDPLTGTLNRRAALSALSAAVMTLERDRGSVAVCFLDLDLFKRVNDRFGHHVGDDALKFLVAQVHHEMRASDVLARLGGEEFLLVLPGAHLKDGLAVAERIRARVAAEGVNISGHPVELTVSIGVAASTNKMKSADAIIDAADQALYQAKNRGRNRVEAMNIVTALPNKMSTEEGKSHEPN